MPRSVDYLHMKKDGRFSPFLDWYSEQYVGRHGITICAANACFARREEIPPIMTSMAQMSH